jgi:hypothetical protein
LETHRGLIKLMSPQARKFLIWGGALVVVLIAIMLIRGSATVKAPVAIG